MSEETVDTAESPAAMTDEERAQLVELKRKESKELRAKAVEAKAKADAEAAEYLLNLANRPLHHVLVRHMGRSARTRTLRAGRAGHRRQGVILGDGTRIKKRGKRYTAVSLTTIADGHARLLEYVRVGALEVCDPKTEQAIPYEALVEMVQSVGEYLADQRDEEFVLRDDESVVEQGQLLGSDSTLNTAPSDDESRPPPVGDDPTRDDLGESAALAAVDQHDAKMRGDANPPSEEELLKLSLDELKTMAVKEFGVAKKDVKKLRAKKDVLALMSEEGS